MRYELRNGLLLPESVTPSIIVFIDETYLLHETGFLQSAVPVPENVYTEELVPLCTDLLQKLGKNAKEFKGSAIKPGNREIYLQFLRYFVNATAHVSDQAELRPIVTVDAMNQYKEDSFRNVYDNVVGGLKNLQIENEANLAAEFSRQILWLYHHWKKVSGVCFANPLVLLFDNKHRYAQKFNENRVVVNEKLVAPMFWELGKTMTSYANTLFTYMTPRVPMPRINRFDFQWSSSEFGLQAADLFSNLVHSALKCEMGIRDDTNDMKYELLLHVMPEFKLDPQLAAALVVDKDAEGRDALRCVDAKLLSTLQLLPG